MMMRLGDATNQTGTLVLGTNDQGQLTSGDQSQSGLELPPGSLGIPSNAPPSTQPAPSSTIDCTTGNCGGVSPAPSPTPSQTTGNSATGISTNAVLAIAGIVAGVIVLSSITKKGGRRR